MGTKLRLIVFQDDMMIFLKRTLLYYFSLMFTPSNKNKNQSIGLPSPKNSKQPDYNLLLKKSTLRSTPLLFDLSFSTSEYMKINQPKPLRKVQTSSTLTSTNILTKSLSASSLRGSQPNSWITPGNSQRQQMIQNHSQLTAKSSNRLKTTQTYQSDNLRNENIGIEEHYSIKISQPSCPSLKNPVLQMNKKVSLKQKQNEEPHKFTNSTNSLRPKDPTTYSSSLQTNIKPAKVINETRLKLRDYLYMVNTSTTMVGSKKRNITASLSSVNKDFDLSEIKTRKGKAAESKKAQNIQKYRISTIEMYNVLKKQVKIDINHLKGKVNLISNWLNNSTNLDNQQLVSLYDLRKEIQHYNQQIQTFCQKQAGNSCEVVEQSLVNIIHQSDEEDQFIQI